MASGAEGPEQLAQDIWLALRGRDWDRVKQLLHPDAQLELAIAPGEILGATETVERWRSAIEQGLFDPKPVGFMELDSNRVFVTGRIKPGTELGNSDSLVLTFKDGLLWRTSYISPDETERAANHEHA